MRIAVLTLNRFNEIDSFLPLAILNRMRAKGWQAFITSPEREVTSMGGVSVHRQKPISFLAKACAVLIGSGN